MATTVSSYFQPMCRSHLAQPARCLEEEYSYSYSELPSSSLQTRRRQFIERCSELRRARGREGDIPVEISVKKTREELTKNACKGIATQRKLNVESGWSKVEEVRKKFEAQAAAGSFSRSFESPPRRRLADSLFASFKLPRRKSEVVGGTMTSQPRSLVTSSTQSKRKSAVELLAETKAFYVKSETVRDRKQELPLRVSSGLGQAIAAGGCIPVSSTAINNGACCGPYPGASPARAHVAHGTLGGARRTVSAGEGLQSTLRRLLDHSDSRESVYWQPVYAVPHKPFTETRRLKDSYCDSGNRSHHNSGTFSGTSSSGTSGSKNQIKSDPEYGAQKGNRPLSFGDARVFFPESFVIPRRRPEPVGLAKNAYSIPSSYSSPENVELPEPPPGTEGEGLDGVEEATISPPAQYAHSTQSRYVRSNSHSQPGRREEELTNINSHKSLPDLHTHSHCYNDNVSTSGAETMGRSPRRRRHSTHQRSGSCSSKGTRSNHSSLVSSCEAPGDDNYSYNRCGSSFARDSGGSSGHYTQRSAPPPHTPHRTDSGSSGQHSHNRYGSYYAEPQYNPSLPEWTVSAPLQFQDGAPSPPPAHPPPPPPCSHYPNTLVGIHFQASAPPPQFQDDTSTVYESCAYGKPPPRCHTLGRGKEYSREYSRYRDGSGDVISKQPLYQEIKSTRVCLDDSGEYVNTTQMHGEVTDVTSPLGTFKRQRCLRYKQRRPRPILRSKSDISDSRYRRVDGRSPSSAPGDPDDSPSSPEETSARLHRFFQHLGMEERAFDAVLSEPAGDETPVFFSDVSTVDSNQLVIGTDYTVQGPQQKPTYRSSEPPSVVERNARIIKWLCNCRKVQQA